MGKLLKITGIIGTVIFILLIVAKLTGSIQYYLVPTGGNEPNIKVNSFVFASNWIEPSKYKLILHERNDSVKEVWVQRLCGIEGDKIEIISGFLHVNDSLVDDKLTLNHAYLVDGRHKSWLEKNLVKSQYDFTEIENNRFLVHINHKELNEKLYSKIYLFNTADEFISSVFNESWSQDNFGPVIVPKDKLFVIGDNRNQSYDSRYIGFINKSDLIGVVIGKQ
ncbi:signal peptidase I [Moheibacter sediminis]|uniref:Signal peptidase I n=1 Tax=Moheibacter sediminis TaxID=1434700 RepID=A0A1W2AZ80_9FLAO|nr:signal peptidase I [Moheibacter sediminis]SMC65986.1 signal peptidase I [Moheibacter sediminis]